MASRAVPHGGFRDSGGHGGSGDSGGHGGSGDLGGHGGSGDSGGHGGSGSSGDHGGTGDLSLIFSGGSGSSVALALRPATQAEVIGPPPKFSWGSSPLLSTQAEHVLWGAREALSWTEPVEAKVSRTGPDEASVSWTEPAEASVSWTEPAEASCAGRNQRRHR